METSPTTRPIAWNDIAILDATGRKPEQIRDLLTRHGQPKPTDMAIYQWVSRKSIPDMWRSRIIYALLRENRLNLAVVFRVQQDAAA